MDEYVYLPCPFCGEEDFDLSGLRLHLLSRWCDEFNKLEDPLPDTPTSDVR